jgi:hypothetical protein
MAEYGITDTGFKVNGSHFNDMFSLSPVIKPLTVDVNLTDWIDCVADKYGIDAARPALDKAEFCTEYNAKEKLMHCYLQEVGACKLTGNGPTLCAQRYLNELPGDEGNWTSAEGQFAPWIHVITWNSSAPHRCWVYDRSGTRMKECRLSGRHCWSNYFSNATQFRDNSNFQLGSNNKLSLFEMRRKIQRLKHNMDDCLGDPDSLCDPERPRYTNLTDMNLT